MFAAGGASGTETFKFAKDKAGDDGKKGKKGKKDAASKDDDAVSTATTDALKTNVGAMLLRTFSSIVEDKSTDDGFKWLAELADKVVADKAELTLTLLEKSIPDDLDWSKLQADTSLDKLRGKSSTSIAEMGLPVSDKPKIFVNGVTLANQAVGVLDASLSEYLQMNLMPIQRALYYGELSERQNILDYFMGQPGVVKRICPRAETLDDGSLLSYKKDTSPLSPVAVLASMKYLEHPNTENRVKPMTVWVVADLETKDGQRLVFESLKSLLTQKNTRVGILHNGDLSKATGKNSIAKFVYAIIDGLDAGPALNAVGKAMAKALSGETEVDKLMKVVKKKKIVKKSLAKESVGVLLKQHAAFIMNSIKVPSGSSAFVVNSRVVGPLAKGELLVAADFALFESKTDQATISKVSKKLKNTKPTSKLMTRDLNDLIVRVATVLTKSAEDPAYENSRAIDTKLLKGLKTNVSAIIVDKKDSEGDLQHQVLAVLDPLSKATQVLSPILVYLSQVTNVDLTVVMNPKLKVSEAPLKRFYHTVLPSMQFSADGSRDSNPAAVFKKLPTAPLLTLGMHVPSSWMVQATDSPYDLDNIHLQKAKHGVAATFTLDYIIVEGNCVAAETRQPTPGLQFQLGTPERGPVFDTIVMSNLGYFQLKAVPGRPPCFPHIPTFPPMLPLYEVCFGYRVGDALLILFLQIIIFIQTPFPPPYNNGKLLEMLFKLMTLWGITGSRCLAAPAARRAVQGYLQHERSRWHGLEIRQGNANRGCQ